MLPSKFPIEYFVGKSRNLDLPAKSRFLLLIIGLYVLPVVALSLYASLVFSSSHSFGVLSAGVLLTVAGSVLLFLNDGSARPALHFSPQVEELSSSAPPVDNRANEEQQAQLEDYRGQLFGLAKQVEVHAQTIAEMRKTQEITDQKAIETLQEFENFQEVTKERQEQARLLLHEHQQTINEQRETLEKKQQQIALLEGQVRDLHYEIKTLMEVEERQSIIRFPMDRYRAKEFDYATQPSPEEDLLSVSPPHIHGPNEASLQLKRCLDIAQKITGGQYMHSRPSSRLKDLPVENTALEMRRLFDNLRSENQATILLYSPKESKLLFVNNPIKSLTGWTPEKFVQQFQELQSDGGEAWRHSINQLSFKNETQATFWLASKSGEHTCFNCQLGLIRTGSFRHYVLGVLYPTKYP